MEVMEVMEVDKSVSYGCVNYGGNLDGGNHPKSVN